MTAAKKTKSKSTRTPRQKADTAEWLINLLMAMPESLDSELASDWLERKMIITEGPFPVAHRSRVPVPQVKLMTTYQSDLTPSKPC